MNRIIKYVSSLIELDRSELVVLLIRKIRVTLSKLSIIFRYRKYKNRKNNIILVYTMGKVGSSTVFETMIKEFPLCKAFHIHFLSNHWLKDKLKDTAGWEYNKKIAFEFFQYFSKNKHKRLKIITLVRDPIARDISEFFQNYRKEGYNIDKMSLFEIIELVKGRGHDLSLNWFESDFSNYLEFNIYDYPFNKDKGYSIYRFDGFDLLVMQTEKLNEIFRDAFREFYGFEVKKLLKANETKGKFKKDFYREIKRLYYEEKAELGKVYQSKYVTHFYAKKDVEKFIRSWENKSD